jgi:hypothetical protein
MGKMKNLFFALMFIIFGISTGCAGQAKIEWDEVTTLTDGKRLDKDAGTIQYRIYIKRKAETPPDNPKEYGLTEALSLYVTPPSKGGPYVVGIRAELVKVVSKSEIVWSDNIDICKEGGKISCTLP